MVEENFVLSEKGAEQVKEFASSRVREVTKEVEEAFKDIEREAELLYKKLLFEEYQEVEREVEVERDKEQIEAERFVEEASEMLAESEHELFTVFINDSYIFWADDIELFGRDIQFFSCGFHVGNMSIDGFSDKSVSIEIGRESVQIDIEDK